MRVEANGFQTEVLVEGEGPPLTLVHGMASGLESWDRVAQVLRRRFQVIRYDLRGHGHSDRLPGSYAIEDFAADLRAILSQLGITRTHLAGFSLGGLIVQSFALNHAQQTDKIVIMSAVANKSPEILARLKKRADDIEKNGAASTMDAALERWFTPEFRQAHPDLVQQRIDRYRQTDPKTFAAAYRTFAEGDLGDQLHRIAAPTLVMTGEHDPGSSAAMAKFMHGQIEGSQLFIVPRLRHNLLLEGADIVAESIDTFLG